MNIPAISPEPQAAAVLGSVEKPRASVILPHLNTPEFLVRALQSLAAQKLDHGRFEIIVVDNGSRIPLTAVKEAWPHVTFLQELEPGPGPARNLGAAHARADVLAFIDSDIQIGSDWLMAGLNALGTKPLQMIGGDLRVDVPNPKRLSGLEAFESVISFRQKLFINKHHYSSTANLMMTRDVFEAVGGFGGINTPEDLNFGRRAHALGIVVRYVPEMVALHPAQGSFEEMRVRWQRLSVQHFSNSRQSGQPLLAWQARSLAVMVSSLAHIPVMLVSPRIAGIGNRLRGIGYLMRIRWARGLDMLRIARKATGADQPSAMNWNR